MKNFVYTLCSSTPGQIQYGGFKRALAKKSGDMIRHQVRILYLLFLWEDGRRYLCLLFEHMLTDIVICSGLAFKKYPWNSQTECEVLLHNVLDIVIRWVSQL